MKEKTRFYMLLTCAAIIAIVCVASAINAHQNGIYLECMARETLKTFNSTKSICIHLDPLLWDI